MLSIFNQNHSLSLSGAKCFELPKLDRKIVNHALLALPAKCKFLVHMLNFLPLISYIQLCRHS